MKKNLFIALALLFMQIATNAQKASIFSVDGKAIRGYDVVAFFTNHQPVIGNDSINYQWNDANWLFASKENKAAFIKNPEKYAPQYGGYCAYGTAGNHKAPTQIDTWTILNDKLYFNYNTKVKELWNKKQDSLIERANFYWPTLK
ncbi:MAG: YHS domain protein [Sphingobacteriia bacterium]|nr:MAG: YHS domain protein [Sphingobacteriia bacterium]